MTRPRPLLAVLLAAALLAAACGGDDGDGPPGSAAAHGDDGRALAVVADGVAVPAYDALVTRLDALTTALDGLCATPGDDTLGAARAAWHEAVLAWQATRPTGVGPAMDHRLMPNVGFEARASSVEELLAGREPVDVEGLAAAGSGVRGIYAIELLLFGDGSDDLLTPDGARRCEMATSASTLAARASTIVGDEWMSEYRDELVAGVGGDRMRSIDDIVNQLIDVLTSVDDAGLRALVAVDDAAEIPLRRRDGPAADRMAQHRAVVAAVATTITGPDGDGAGVAALVEARSPGTATRLVEAAEAAVAALDALPDSVAEAFTDRAALTRAADAVAALKVLLSTEVVSQLGVTIRFSDADGDS